jgi:hypothetical protein
MLPDPVAPIIDDPINPAQPSCCGSVAREGMSGKLPGVVHMVYRRLFA